MRPKRVIAVKYATLSATYSNFLIIDTRLDQQQLFLPDCYRKSAKCYVLSKKLKCLLQIHLRNPHELWSQRRDLPPFPEGGKRVGYMTSYRAAIVFHFEIRCIQMHYRCTQEEETAQHFADSCQHNQKELPRCNRSSYQVKRRRPCLKDKSLSKSRFKIANSAQI